MAKREKGGDKMTIVSQTSEKHEELDYITCITI
jgi:hypothetical protein